MIILLPTRKKCFTNIFYLALFNSIETIETPGSLGY